MHKYINKVIQGNDNNTGYLNILFSLPEAWSTVPGSVTGGSSVQACQGMY